MTSKPFHGRKLRVCFWDTQNRVLTAAKLELENQLRKLVDDVETVSIASLADPKFSPCDLLIITADHVPEEEFVRWLEALTATVHRQGVVWVPALIMADVDPASWTERWFAIVKNNWYFDIISSDSLASVPIRVANLLRIHDHLHELVRYAKEVNDLQGQVREIEARLQDISQEPATPAGSGQGDRP